MENNRPLAPALLTKADQSLLIRRPVTWSTRIHLVAWYGLLVCVLIAGFSLLSGNDLKNEYQNGNWTVLLSMMSFVAIVIWLVYLLRFNVFKRFGRWKEFDTLKTYLFYFLSILIFVSWPFIPPVVKTIRVNLKYSSNELLQDMNAINYKVCQLEKNSLDHTFVSDTLQVNDSLEDEERKSYLTADSLTAYQEHFTYVNTDLLVKKLAEADSSLQLNDSLYVVYTYPNYEFINNFDIWSHATGKRYYSPDLYREVIRNKEPVDSARVMNELTAVLKKYMTSDDIRIYGEPGTVKQQYLDATVGPLEPYHLSVVNDNIWSITEKKYRFGKEGIQAMVRAIYYITLVISLLVVLFRHLTPRAFFLWLLTGFILFVFTILTLSGSGDVTVFFGLILVYFFLFLLIALSVFATGRQSTGTGISICFAVFLTPFVPLLVTSIYYESYVNDQSLIKYSDRALHYNIAEITGFVLLLLLLLTVYKNLFKKWYASPQE